MKEYVKPELEIIIFEDGDVITYSDVDEGFGEDAP